MLTRLGARALAWAESTEPWTNVYGLARTMLALGTLSTLLFTAPENLFHPATGIAQVPVCGGLARTSLFCQLPAGHLHLMRWVAVAILAVAASGWRPRWTGVLHWWVSLSFLLSATVIDGGDQVTSVITLLLIPVTLTDARRWHWGALPASGATGTLRGGIARLTALSALTMVRIQVAGIYFHAAVAKLKVTEWQDGTAVYYWFNDPWFGMAAWLRPLMGPLVAHGATVTAFTWGTLVLESFLFAGLLMEKKHRKWLLATGLFFHFGILLVHGLVSFVLAMWACLVLFLRPVEMEIGWLRLPRAAQAVARRRIALRGVGIAAPAPVPAEGVAGD